ncbi:hypothetical protein [Mesorhizobium sp. M8A.F.Ca.ET.057.01.1.1]|uniref:hypothetical protein n=1 Tax=Mesorhizobium sp. M8A.F.Ca.ET.057.01.1.1 TaxID=2493679 RepID=UPI001ABF060C|nr:hypothetical protein [Mesorhizobium sp. M8A.F.Ca.ET.057.01.1.1]
MSNVQKLHLLKQRQKLFGQVRPETIVVEVGDNFPLACNVSLASQHVLLQHRQNGFPHRLTDSRFLALFIRPRFPVGVILKCL